MSHPLMPLFYLWEEGQKICPKYFENKLINAQEMSEDANVFVTFGVNHSYLFNSVQCAQKVFFP